MTTDGMRERRLRVGDRRALAVLAAGAGRVPEIPADHVDLAHELRPLSHEGRAAQRLRELPVADPIALRDLEGEVAAHDVDLPAAHLLHEDAVLDRAHDLVGIRIRPDAIIVFVIRQIGRWRKLSRRALPLRRMPSFSACLRSDR